MRGTQGDALERNFFKKVSLKLPPHMYHGVKSESDLSRFTFTLDIISPSQSHFYKEVLAAINSLERPYVLNHPYMCHVFEEIRGKYASGENSRAVFDSYHRHLLLSSAVGVIIDMLMNRLKAPTESKLQKMTDSDREYIIRDFISLYYSAPNALEVLAKNLHLSTRQTQTVVEQIMGKNFKSLILDQKMPLAKLLIESTDNSLADICESIGYDSYSSFYTAYRNYYGCTPTQHRKKSLEENTSKNQENKNTKDM